MPRTIEVRFERAAAAMEQLRDIAEGVTAETPGRARASAIIRARGQYNIIYLELIGVALATRPKAGRWPTQDEADMATRTIDAAHDLVEYARRFSK